MSKLSVKNESLPTRCEVCHQDDFFDPKTGYCARCAPVATIKWQSSKLVLKPLCITLFRLPPGILAIAFTLIPLLGYLVLETALLLLLLPITTLFGSGTRGGWMRSYPNSLHSQLATRIIEVWHWIFAALIGSRVKPWQAIVYVALPLILVLVFVPMFKPDSAIVLPTQASAQDKYSNLLRKIAVPEDRATYGDYKDYGYWSGSQYRNYEDLPAGYWVYLYPHWYIWKQQNKQQRQVQPVQAVSDVTAWSAAQATGTPDTPQAGDYRTAWASLLPDGGLEWLKLDYEHAIKIAEVRVRESYNSGTIVKVAAVLDNGSETLLWEGQDTTSTAPADFLVQPKITVKAKSIKVYLDTRLKPGWNEIDAVELIGQDGSGQWASRASASSSYADRLKKE
ncbi:MAG: hypothetical protein AB1489_33905 [Acidobacteriota bacterium]